MLHSPYYVSNFGHVLGDDIWGIWQGLYFFNSLNENSTILYPESIRSHPSEKLYELLPVSLKRYKRNERMCYEKLMMGWTRFGYAQMA